MSISLSQHRAIEALAGFPARWPVPHLSCCLPQQPLTILPGSWTGSYEEAGDCLQNAPQPTPGSEAARARRGLLWLKKGDAPAAARDLQCLAETDAQELCFLLQRLEASERRSLSQVCSLGPAVLTAAPPSLMPWYRCGSGGQASLAIINPSNFPASLQEASHR